MKHILYAYILILILPVYAQQPDSKNWTLFSNEDVAHITLSQTGTFVHEDITLKVVWDEKLSYSENIGYYGGIKTLNIYFKNEHINTFNNIEDTIALGEIYISFFDYNMDGYIDFSLPLNEKWLTYYLFNPVSKQFENNRDWDYLKIQRVNKKTKQILTHPDGNIDAYKTLYQVDGLNLIKLKKIDVKID